MTKRLARLAASTSLLVAATMPASTAFSAIVVTKAQSTHRLLPRSTKPTAVRDPATHDPLRKLLASAANRAPAPGGLLLVKTPAWSWRTSFGAARIPRSFGTTQVGARALAAVGHVEAGAAVPRQTRPSSHVYRDARLDTPSAPDITSVAVAIDGSRWLTLKVSFANRSGLLPSDLLVVGLDVDRDRRTGGPMGMDYALSATTAGAELGVWNSSSWTGSGYVPIPGAATLSVSGHSVALSTPVGQLGALMESPRPKLRFVLIAIANFDQPEANWTDDVAGPWIYKLNSSGRSVASMRTAARRVGQ
jgi:hypothetical protein